MSSERVSAHLTGCAEGATRRGSDEILRIHGALRAEAPTDPRTDHSQVASVPCRASPQLRRAPSAAPDGRSSTSGCPACPRLGEDPVVLHRRAGQPLTDHRDLGDRRRRPRTDRHRRRGRCRSTRSTRAPGNRIGCIGHARPPGGGDDRIQPLVVDDHGVRCVDGLSLRRRHHGGDDVADEPHDVRWRRSAGSTSAGIIGKPWNDGMPRSSPRA